MLVQFLAPLFFLEVYVLLRSYRQGLEGALLFESGDMHSILRYLDFGQKVQK